MKKYYPIYDCEMEEVVCVIVADEKPDATVLQELFEEYQNDNVVKMQKRDELWKEWMDIHRDDIAKRFDFPEIMDKSLERCITCIGRCKFHDEHPFEHVLFDVKIKEAGFDVISFLPDDYINVGQDC